MCDETIIPFVVKQHHTTCPSHGAETRFKLCILHSFCNAAYLEISAGLSSAFLFPPPPPSFFLASFLEGACPFVATAAPSADEEETDEEAAAGWEAEVCSKAKEEDDTAGVASVLGAAFCCLDCFLVCLPAFT